LQALRCQDPMTLLRWGVACRPFLRQSAVNIPSQTIRAEQILHLY